MDLQYLHEIVSGRAKGIWPGLIRGCLSCLTPIYRLGLWWKTRKFDSDPDSAIQVDVPVISIGNLTTGGTGKTPMVVWLCRYLRSEGHRVAIVSRGYQSGDSGSNDEALELESRLPDVPHLQDPDRVRIANIAIEELESQVIVMDDGFQHRRLARDLDLVLIDATNPFGYQRLLPRGLLREPLAALKRCDGVVVTRCDRVTREELDSISDRIRSVVDVPIAMGRTRSAGVQRVGGNLEPLDVLQGSKCFVFSAIGNPRAFEGSVRDLGVEVVGSTRFRDHHRFTREELAEVGKAAIQAGATALLCTHKDLVKIASHRVEGLDVWALMIEFEIDQGEDLIRGLVEGAVG